MWLNDRFQDGGSKNFIDQPIKTVEMNLDETEKSHFVETNAYFEFILNQ